MATVTILRDLWRRRFIVVAIYVVALLVGLFVVCPISFPPKLESRQYSVGVASVRVLVDTPSSQVIDVAPKGSDTVGVRANLLASLMVDGEVKAAIARRARLRPDQFQGIAESAVPTTDAPAPKPRAHGYVLTTRVQTNDTGDALPIIEIETQAPDANGAQRLANAAVLGLKDYLDSQAAVDRIQEARRLRVSGLGGAQASTVVRGPSGVIGVAVMLFVFGLGCAILLGLSALGREWRASSDEDV